MKSCVLLAALAADGASTVSEPERSRDHTERMLLAAGATIHRNGRHVTVTNTDELVLEHVRVPGDPSSAAFLLAAGVLVRGSRLLIRDVGVNWTRTGFLRILMRMQGIVLGDLEDETGELSRRSPVSDLDVAAGGTGGDVRGARGGAAGDRRAAAGRAARLLRRRRDGGARRGRAAPEGVRPDRHRGRAACAVSARRSRRPRTASR